MEYFHDSKKEFTQSISTKKLPTVKKNYGRSPKTLLANKERILVMRIFSRKLLSFFFFLVGENMI
jgi:hypothetical protein